MTEARATQGAATPLFAERPTELVVRDAYRFGAVPLAFGVVAGLAGYTLPAAALLGLAIFIGCFFRNPSRTIAGDEWTVVAPADGRVIAVGEVERPDGSKAQRIGIFLSIFNVHVNRSPVAGRVVSIERGGAKYLAAFDGRAETDNARCALELALADGRLVTVVQITGLIARRIVCHPEIGEWVRRGERYGLIRFGSRTDVVLPLGSEILVSRGDRVRGGSSPIARLEEAT